MSRERALGDIMDYKEHEKESRGIKENNEGMKNDTSGPSLPAAQSRLGWLKLLGIVVIATIITTVATVWVITVYLFPSELKPVTLSDLEEQTLTAKIERLDPLQKADVTRKEQSQSTGEMLLKPERYSEDASGREIVLSERELNALLAKNTEFAKRLAIDLSGDLASMKLLMPLDEDVPVFGGKTLKVTAGVELTYAGGKPVVALKGVSVWGVPLPNAWLGNLKNVDLVKEFGAREGFWNAFAAGIDGIKIEEGHLRVKLKE